jgi:hypothetical protein
MDVDRIAFQQCYQNESEPIIMLLNFGDVRHTESTAKYPDVNWNPLVPATKQPVQKGCKKRSPFLQMSSSLGVSGLARSSHQND